MSKRSLFATEQILGIPFFHGSVAEAVEEGMKSGLVVAPSGTCFERFLEDEIYRRAILSADLVLPDSGAMVSIWRLLHDRSLNRISGLAYLKALLERVNWHEVLWVLPHARAQERLLAWSETQSSTSGVSPSACYRAPFYGPVVEDPQLLALIHSRKPRHIIVAIGAGAQEKLGWYLREHVSERLAVHCIGGALGFVTGDQASIPDWADRLYLGWFLRFLSQPRVFVPRLWKARILPLLLRRFGSRLPCPDLKGKDF